MPDSSCSPPLLSGKGVGKNEGGTRRGKKSGFLPLCCPYRRVETCCIVDDSSGGSFDGESKVVSVLTSGSPRPSPNPAKNKGQKKTHKKRGASKGLFYSETIFSGEGGSRLDLILMVFLQVKYQSSPRAPLSRASG